jgi:hypothetical protein
VHEFYALLQLESISFSKKKEFSRRYQFHAWFAQFEVGRLLTLTIFFSLPGLPLFAGK